jgi:hypothetical protein
MKKLFTLAATLFAAICMNAGDITIALTSMTAGENSYAYDGNEIKAKSNNVYIELPGANVQGSITIKGSSNKSDRFLYIYGEGGTVKDESRAIEMKSDGETINFSASDIILVSEVPYLLFSTADDFKFKKFNYTYEEGKTIVSTVETLTDAKINGVSLDVIDLNELISSQSVTLPDAYATAPTVTFTKHVVITYDDSSTKESDVDVEVVAEALGSNQWTANITLNGADTYSITMQRAVAYTVTYKLADESVLGTEVVAAGGHPAEYAQYEVMPLSSFNGWYDSEYLETVDLTQVVVNSDTSFYAAFDKAYAQSIDFEGMVINNGKSYNVKSALTAKFYDYKTIDALDSLNNEKGAARNEPYLGLKIKKQGGYLACNVLPGTTIRIKFGYVGDKVLAIAGNDTMPLNPTNNKIADLEFPIMVETLVKLQTTTDKTVVIKQIMIDEPLATWMYPITYAPAENGKVEGWTIAFQYETVELTVTPNEGYMAASVTAGNEAVVPVEDVYSFTMPGQAVTVSATFEVDPTTAISNTNANVKAVKVVRNGQLFIEKNGVIYNAQGAAVK